MIITTAGLFDGFLKVVRTTEILRGCGFSGDEIGMVTHHTEANETFTDVGGGQRDTERKHTLRQSLDIGAIGTPEPSLVVKGIGVVVATGPLAFLLIETTDETKSADLIDALSILDVAIEEAEYYAEGIRRGGTLVTVSAASHLAERAEDVLLLNGAVDIRQRSLRWKQQGWKGFNLLAKPYTPEELASERQQQAQEQKQSREWNPYNSVFRSHCYLTYEDSNLPYEHYAPAYRYGYQLASDERYDKKDWCEIETHVQQAWQKHNATDWMSVVDAISYGFATGRANYAYRSKS